MTYSVLTFSITLSVCTLHIANVHYRKCMYITCCVCTLCVTLHSLDCMHMEKKSSISLHKVDVHYVLCVYIMCDTAITSLYAHEIQNKIYHYIKWMYITYSVCTLCVTLRSLCCMHIKSNITYIIILRLCTLRIAT